MMWMWWAVAVVGLGWYGRALARLVARDGLGVVAPPRSHEPQTKDRP
jgi:glycerol-3-phosphate dehydrogenase